MPDLYDDISKYLEKSGGFRIGTEGIDDLVGKIRAYTGIDQKTAKLIVKLFFKEIINAVMRKESVVLYGVGTFISRYDTRNGIDIFRVPTFSAHKNLLRKLLESEDGRESKEQDI